MTFIMLIMLKCQKQLLAFNINSIKHTSECLSRKNNLNEQLKLNFMLSKLSMKQFYNLMDRLLILHLFVVFFFFFFFF